MSLQAAIKKRFSGFSLDVSLNTNGGVMGILGASGSGKSMTLKCIAGIETPDEGRIVLNGRVLFDSEKHINLPPQKRKVGYLFQNYALFPNMTVETNIAAGLSGSKEEKQEAVARMIRLFKLEGLEKRYPSQLSGGQSRGFDSQGFHSQGDFGGFGGRSAQAKGSDLHSEVTVSFEDAAFGCDKMLRLSDPSGNGAVQTLKVHIPAGIEDGKSIRLKGKGNPGFNGGPAGDLFLKVNITSKNGFERKGMDVYTTTEIPFTTAVFGGEAKVSTLYGDVICKIPEGAQTGRKIRLRGKGIVSMKDPAVHGDQYVTIRIQVPQNLSPEAKEKLREFQQVCRNDERKRRGSVA